jgi:hypothetical protein
MTDLAGADEAYFSEESYQKYLNQKTQIHNEKKREDNETIFDVLMSPEADFTKTTYGEEIISAIKKCE